MNRLHGIRHHPAPPQRSTCIRMQSGILPFQLCEREYECTGYPLDITMRNHGIGTGTSRPVARGAVGLTTKIYRELP